MYVYKATKNIQGNSSSSKNNTTPYTRLNIPYRNTTAILAHKTKNNKIMTTITLKRGNTSKTTPPQKTKQTNKERNTYNEIMKITN